MVLTRPFYFASAPERRNAPVIATRRALAVCHVALGIRPRGAIVRDSAALSNGIAEVLYSRVYVTRSIRGLGDFASQLAEYPANDSARRVVDAFTRAILAPGWIADDSIPLQRLVVSSFASTVRRLRRRRGAGDAMGRAAAGVAGAASALWVQLEH